MKICMQNMKRIDCNVAMWRLDDVGVLILFIMVNKKKFRKSTTCETYVYSIALLLFHIWVGTKHCCCESLCLVTKLCGVGCRFAIA